MSKLFNYQNLKFNKLLSIILIIATISNGIGSLLLLTPIINPLLLKKIPYTFNEIICYFILSLISFASFILILRKNKIGVFIIYLLVLIDCTYLLIIGDLTTLIPRLFLWLFLAYLLYKDKNLFK
ncbi:MULTISPECIES: hypothetical protein [Clostridium]|uniref:Uncharacterized protein n=1 Tax=Clostridium paraputrificum TaxID=29363 RepID=A0A174RBS7_9CLOT|nr:MULTISPECIES: hypothetical protein [Clostridium]MBS7129456.1 hypothetical protein [Clostridium sp.]MDB2101710.1 hypothetical protein [Clostridium paraputrificum]MDB2124999.1 hypothetical protein [Clostridium paraputrificum]MDC0802864.1 hypothetical protein [Clostridium paraputrificum]MDU1583923.1 hypothetical protein [Clostridium sp.]